MTRIFERPSSRAATRARDFTANLLLVYAAMPATASMPAVEEIKMIEPAPACFMGAIECLIEKKQPS